MFTWICSKATEHLYVHSWPKDRPQSKGRNEKMSLSRKLLESMGLEADKVSTIIEAHAETVDSLKAQIQEAKNNNDSVEDLKKQLASAQEELKTLKDAGGDWQKKYEEVSAEFETFKHDQAEKDLKVSKESAFRKLLIENGVSEKKIDRIVKYTDLTQAELEDGSFKDVDNLMEGVKAEWSDSFTTSETTGTNTQIPPANSNIRFTTEDIAKMSPEEINKNWNAIKDSMKGEN